MLADVIAYGLFGLIIGSFLNVLILRHGARSLEGRSGCMACGRQLRWFELFPIVSWVALRGRCRSCRTWISIQYPIVEALTGCLFIMIGLAPIGIFAKAIGFAAAAFLVAIAVYDFHHTIIPDEWVWSFNALALIMGLLSSFSTSGYQISSVVLAGPLVAFPLFALWAASQGAWMGLGDPKLALGIGWLLGLPAGLYAIFLAFIIGALVSVFVLLPVGYLRHVGGITRLGASRRSFTMKSEVPFGPFLVASCLMVWGAMLYGLPLPFLV